LLLGTSTKCIRGLRSVTLGTSDLSKTKDLFENILGFNSSKKGENALRFGDVPGLKLASPNLKAFSPFLDELKPNIFSNKSLVLDPGTRIHFVEVPKSNYQNLHIDSVGLRTPSDSGLDYH
jgi:glyoxalase family protein